VQFNQYPDYIFVDPLLDPKKPVKILTDTLQPTHTDEQGQAEFDLNLSRFEKATYRLTFYAEGFEADGGRSVTTQSSVLVSPLSYFVGYKPEGDLNYIKQNSQQGVNFIAINPQLKPVVLDHLKIQLIALHPVTTLVKKPDGTYQYQSIMQSNIVSTKPFIIDEQGTHYTLPTEQIGNFAISILDEKNTELSRFNMSVVGASQLSLAKNAELSVKLNKSEYHADEEIELQITAPYTGAGLITIERDHVYATQWFKTTTTNSIQKIRIPKDFQGNGYVNVAFVRDWNSPDIFISPLSYSVVPFSVDRENHAIHIDLNMPALARPGEPFKIQYKSDKPGKIIIFAVDEGVLQVATYKTPDPLAFYFEKHALEVMTQQTLDQILPQFIQDRELSAVGGDGAANKMLMLINPFKRKTDLPVVYWSGIVDTDTSMRELVYQVPDYFNGTLRVMAVAVTEDAVGSAEKKSEIRGHFVINPNVPTFVAPQDEFEVTASIANNVKESGTNANIAVQLQVTSELEILGSSQQTVNIPEGQEKTLHFKLRAKSLLGSANIAIVASMGDQLSKMHATLSVRPPSSFVTSVMSGRAKDANQSLTMNRVLYPEYREVNAMISSSPLILVAGLQRYLDKFPYGCTEQLTSKALPLLAMANQPWFTMQSRDIATKIQTTIQMLEQRQMSSGGFSYWPGVGENSSNAFASVYATHFLTEARAQGYDVPADMLRASLSYLKELATQPVTNLEQARIQAYAIYILTRNEIVTTNYLTNLQLYLDKNQADTWHHDITNVYMAATYQLLKSETDANQLLDRYQPLSNPIATDFYNAPLADAQYLYLLARHFPDRLARVGDSLVMPLVNDMNSDEINTVFSGYTSLALSAYAQSHQLTEHATFSISETLPGDQQKTLAAPDSAFSTVNVDALAKKINFTNPNKATYFYQITQAGFDKILPSAIVKQGLEIFREYRDLKNNVISTTILGDEIEVHIVLRALNNRYLNNIAVVDLLPGGFEVVRDSVNTENSDYADIREDRVVFFLSMTPDAKEIIYRIKATNAGKYVVPPIFAGSMYDPHIQGQGLPALFTVTH
jgi:uncharacterized protein YfaS (alpha-2-macroglobulin family)